MKPLAVLRARLVAGKFEFTKHALKRVVERNIANNEIREAGARAVIIGNYPADKALPAVSGDSLYAAQRKDIRCRDSRRHPQNAARATSAGPVGGDGCLRVIP